MHIVEGSIFFLNKPTDDTVSLHDVELTQGLPGSRMCEVNSPDSNKMYPDILSTERAFEVCRKFFAVM